MIVLTRLSRDILKENNKSKPLTNQCQVRICCVWVTKKDTHHRCERKAKIKQKPRTRLARRGSRLVPVAGLEPARYRYRWILSPLRLPIPSHRHLFLVCNDNYYILSFRKNQQVKSQNFKISVKNSWEGFSRPFKKVSLINEK